MTEIDQQLAYVREHEAHWTEQERARMAVVAVPFVILADATFVRTLYFTLKERIAMAKGATKERKPKQGKLMDVDHPAQKELVPLANEYAEARDERMQCGLKEQELKGSLLQAMKKHKLEKFTNEDLEIEIVHEEETVKVRKIKKKKSDDPEA